MKADKKWLEYYVPKTTAVPIVFPKSKTAPANLIIPLPQTAVVKKYR